MTAEQRWLMRLCRAGFLGETPPEPPPEIDLAEVLRLAEMHKVSALVAEALLRCRTIADAPRREAKHCMDTVRYTEAVQCYETTELLRRYAESNVDCCPLKGWYWRLLYAAPYLRDMGDVDLLIRLDQWEAACRIAEECGFERSEKQDIDLHAVLYKGDVKLELHRSLLSSHGLHEGRYRDLWQGLKPGSAPHEWRLPPTDDYLYSFLHAEKHVAGYWFTLRMLTDVYALRAGPAIDRAQFVREARRMGLLGYAEHMEALADAWLKDLPLEPAQEATLDYLMSLTGLKQDEQRYRAARRWLHINLSPGALWRRLLPPSALLLARYEDATRLQAIKSGLLRAWWTYRMYISDYRLYKRRIPLERRRALNRGMRALYKRPRR